MSLPTRAPQGITTLEAVNANLFQLAEQYYGDATQWVRISDLNAQGGVAPDFLIAGSATLMIPPSTAAWPPAAVSVERLLFGTDG